MDEQYYRLRLDDYASPSFVSWEKSYFGTLRDIRNLVEALTLWRKDNDTLWELIDGFRAFDAGNHNVLHHVAYQEVLLLEPVKLLGSETDHIENYMWEHCNTWGCSYTMRCDSVETKHLWLKSKDGYHRAFKARFKNLQYEGISGMWHSLDGGFWGFPMMIASDEGFQYNRLAVQERKFDNYRQAEKDRLEFAAAQNMDFSQFCNDIFGSG